MPPEIQLITSRQNPAVQRLIALLDKKERRKSGLFRIDGFKLFEEAVACGLDIERVYLQQSVANTLSLRVLEICPGVPVTLLSDEVFSRVTEERAPQGIVTVLHKLTRRHFSVECEDAPKIALECGRIMAFESIRDPGNLGGVIRSASAFGIDTLILSDDCADIYNPKTLRGAMGAVFSRNILFSRDLPGLLRALSGASRRVLAATLSQSAVPIDEVGLTGRDIVVIGNEGHGLSEETVAAADRCVILPIESGPGVESLNATVAASVFMWEQRRLGL